MIYCDNYFRNIIKDNEWFWFKLNGNKIIRERSDERTNEIVYSTAKHLHRLSFGCHEAIETEIE